MSSVVVATGQAQPVAQVSMSAACRASVEAFVSRAQQQVPALAQGLQPQQLQDFLCGMHAQCQGLQESGHSATGSVVEVRLSSSQAAAARQDHSYLMSLR